MTIPPHGGTDLWFQDESLQNFIAGATKYYLGPPIIQVPVATIWQMHLPQTIKFTREKGYDIKPGDVIEVAHSPEYQMKGIVQVIGQEVFMVRGDQKGFQAMLYGIGSGNCTIAINGQARTTLKCQDVVTRCITPPHVSVPSNSSSSVGTDSNPSSSQWTAWNVSQDINVANNPLSAADLSSLKSDPWTVDAQDIQDSINARVEKLKDNGPLPWFMSKEFSSHFLTYHAMFTVSPSFSHAKFYKCLEFWTPLVWVDTNGLQVIFVENTSKTPANIKVVDFQLQLVVYGLPIYCRLQFNDEDSGCSLTIEDVIIIVKQLTPLEVKEQLLKQIRHSAMAPTYFNELAEAISTELVREELIGQCVQLLKDNEAEACTAAADQILGFSKLLEKKVILAHHHAFGLALLLGRDATIEHLLSLSLHLLKVKFWLNVIIIDIKLLSDSLPIIIELAKNKPWNLCMSWLGDTVFSICEFAPMNLKKLTEVFNVDWAKVQIVPKVMDME
ncbi:uncharacterized protein BJ212DRAFT_1301259 [Suillus subaureus]|uniref:Phosphatase PP2A regulatory subunit A/Splicing factor 3B subunit 1-like HEAT repeat domain-containing protein n=1 Tax=Suillus subaureus TaxID=48587 RepID=A0A9P7E6V0_9AGAM|nr:uncharacterized protein BJ212DRAFT_1301259 [Suillus subaureus]KAG1812761.1 hypothetical protein BJ212DRAFT_1301259 [Suillus subaureus]